MMHLLKHRQHFRMFQIHKKILFLLACVALFSCTDVEKVVIPPDILSEEKMAKIMKDLSLLEASLSVHVASIDKTTAANSRVKMNIYVRNGITQEEFAKSYKFYADNPEAMNEMYQIVLNELSKMQATVSGK